MEQGADRLDRAAVTACVVAVSGGARPPGARPALRAARRGSSSRSGRGAPCCSPSSSGSAGRTRSPAPPTAADGTPSSPRSARLARERGTSVGVVLLDLDHFKAINERHGHAAGDEALRQVAAPCCARRGGRDLVARLGGDEFAVLLPGRRARTVPRSWPNGSAPEAAELRPGRLRAPGELTVSLGVSSAAGDAGVPAGAHVAAPTRSSTAPRSPATRWARPASTRRGPLRGSPAERHRGTPEPSEEVRIAR